MRDLDQATGVMAKKRGNGFLLFLLGVWLLSAAVPPWVYTFSVPRSGTAATPAGYHLLWVPPAPKSSSHAAGVRVDLDRLLIQWAIIAAIGGAHIVLRRQRRDTETARGGGDDA